jgi:type IV secretory pathway TraG/TraD family ATPase VirD4
MIGDHEVPTTSVSTSESGKSTSVSMRTERILPPDAIRALPKGRALLFATGLRPAMLNLRPWFKEPAARHIAPASAAATQAITKRAIAKTAPADARRAGAPPAPHVRPSTRSRP